MLRERMLEQGQLKLDGARPGKRRAHRRMLRFLAGIGVLAVIHTPLGAIAAELSTIQQRGYLVVGVKDNLRPLGFRTAEGELAGLEIDLAHQLATALLGDPNAVQFQPLANTERLSAVLDDRVDLVIAHLTATEARTRLVNFSTPYFLDGTALLTRDGAIATLSDLRDQSIAVLDGSSAIATLRSVLPQARLVGVSSYAAALEAMEQGRAIAVSADVSVLTGWAQADDRYHLMAPLLSAAPLAVAMPKGLQYDELRRRVDAAILHWQVQGNLRQRIQYWGLPEAGTP